jgi:hypothetical protein
MSELKSLATMFSPLLDHVFAPYGQVSLGEGICVGLTVAVSRRVFKQTELQITHLVFWIYRKSPWRDGSLNPGGICFGAGVRWTDGHESSTKIFSYWCCGCPQAAGVTRLFPACPNPSYFLQALIDPVQPCPTFPTI